MIGINFEVNHVATGLGNHLARPILRDEWHENLTFEEAVRLLEKCMRVLLYRDRSAVNKIQVLSCFLLLLHSALPLPLPYIQLIQTNFQNTSTHDVSEILYYCSYLVHLC